MQLNVNRNGNNENKTALLCAMVSREMLQMLVEAVLFVGSVVVVVVVVATDDDDEASLTKTLTSIAPGRTTMSGGFLTSQ